ncbi:MAG: cation:proton antiporter [Tropicimonas sp.]|uniref:cation:proton antiporter n=1 Tax=Tropicimonas sp. TaxID=2067044 RepID=UPI003A869AB7
MSDAAGVLAPEVAFALVGAIGVGAQWLAWRLAVPAIVLMLAAGLIIGPGLELMIPARDIGPLVSPMVAIAVAIILFEGGLTLQFRALGDAAAGVWRLVVVGVPVGWALSAFALHYVAGLGWASASVFGGIMIVTGPTVIAPMLRHARLPRRPSALLQWEAIVNDPIGALAAIVAFWFVLKNEEGASFDGHFLYFLTGIALAGGVGWLAGWLVSRGFRRGWVPEYMKVPVLFVAVLAVFVGTNLIVHESGLLAVTLMGIIIANAHLPSFTELRRFKEQATVLLVSGVFILLAASINVEALKLLDWRAAAFVIVVVLVVRPATVLLSLLGTGLPRSERLLVAFTGPRGVVLVAVAGLFGQKLSALGVADGARIMPLAFVLVVATVVLHGFTLVPMARFLGVADERLPGVLLVGGSRFTTAIGKALAGAGVPVLVTDRSHARLRRAREAGLETFYGDILSEAAEHGLDLVNFELVLAANDNDAYNTLVATDLAPEFGRDNVFQLAKEKEYSRRHALPATFGGRPLGRGVGHDEMEKLMAEGWEVKLSRMTEAFGFEDWRRTHPEAIVIGRVSDRAVQLLAEGDDLRTGPGTRLLVVGPRAANGTRSLAGIDPAAPRDTPPADPSGARP